MSETASVTSMNYAVTDQTTPSVYEIDPITRIIGVPSDLLLGVESDEKSNRIYFRCKKVVGDNIDLSTLTLRVNYQNANGDKLYESIEDVTEDSADSDYITFSWSLSREVTVCKGIVTFSICAVKKTGIEITTEWNTIPTTGKVEEGLEVLKANTNDVSILRGDTFTATLTIQDDQGETYTPEEGDSIVFAMKKNLSDETTALEKTIPTDTLKFTLAFSDTKTLDVGDYVYCVKLTKASGDVCTIIPESVLTLVQEVA